ncbi:hypothetical protein Nepgr_029312 [Nepenthes gracilis]|uniref:beta-ketoacyl-[acyl-carrier-protein] synthase I n=1 Tax=Nepenthes gracilis TaxID=150966 RepID=A0AAD3TED6_NEPGR|nr:hypothetical protein Nepgr_029312 [Nepenthes gracilis]
MTAASMIVFGTVSSPLRRPSNTRTLMAIDFPRLRFVAGSALSERNNDPRTASMPWDKDRDGFVMGEDAEILILESLEHAMKRDAPIIAESLGGAVNCDACHITDPRSDGLGVSSCIEKSLKDAGVSPEEFSVASLSFMHPQNFEAQILRMHVSLVKFEAFTVPYSWILHAVHDSAVPWCCWGFGSHYYSESCHHRLASSQCERCNPIPSALAFISEPLFEIRLWCSPTQML